MKSSILTTIFLVIFASSLAFATGGGGGHEHRQCPINIEIGWGGDTLNAEGGDAEASAEATSSSSAYSGSEASLSSTINYTNRTRIPWRVPGGTVAPAPGGVSDDGRMFDMPFFTSIDGKKTGILPDNVFRIDYLGENWYEIHQPEGIYLVRFLGPNEMKSIKQGILRKAEEGELFYSRSVQETVRGANSRRPKVFVIVDEFFERQYVSKNANPLSGIAGRRDGAVGGGIGKNTSWEENAKNAILRAFEVYLGPYVVYVTTEEDGLVSEIDGRINQRSQELNACQDAGANNAGLRLEQGKDHLRRFYISDDGSVKAGELDRAFINFLQSVRDLPTVEGYLFLAATQYGKGWDDKARASMKRAGYPNWTWEQLDEYVSGEFVKEPMIKAEKLTPIKKAKPKAPEKPEKPEKTDMEKFQMEWEG